MSEAVKSPPWIVAFDYSCGDPVPHQALPYELGFREVNKYIIAPCDIKPDGP
jgi:hypothetical protein